MGPSTQHTIVSIQIGLKVECGERARARNLASEREREREIVLIECPPPYWTGGAVE